MMPAQRYPNWLAAALYVLAFATALAVVWSRHESRRLFIELQALQKDGDALYENWSALQLERGTWATHHRMEDIARERLGLELPQQEVLVFVEADQERQ